ncbi:MAG: hypothetical protein JXA73_00175 [Acidobacteria bacterium]|nr:hypothetical protein [Acidobacteriota bacterium]
MHALDARTASARALIAWQKELFKALGGEATCNPEKKALVDLAVRTRLFIENLDFWLLGQQSLVSAKHRAILPALRERQVLVDSLARMLTQLGLEDANSQKKGVPDIRDYMKAKQAGGGQEV